MPVEKRITVRFFKSPSPANNEPVRVWLKALSIKDKKAIGQDIKTVELSWPIGYPLVEKLDADLWEVRTTLDGRISRVFFTVWEGFMVLLHGIIKKSQKPPKQDLDLAKKRRNSVLKGDLVK
ncbi:MAG: type II toxin-antitoxin system RelE/ParE family toxin [Treponema sp.]|jgi:phage-related protein|nr:type II toxin-antitoxin system RelE/ParE family toxin [Treponema sp.]